MADPVRAVVGEHVVSWGVRSGRFPASRMDYWAESYMADPVGTTRMIESLTPILAASASQQIAAASGDGSVDAEFAHLFPPATSETAPPVIAAVPASGDTITDADLRAAGIDRPTWAEIDAAQRASDTRISLLSVEELEAELFGPED